MSHLKKKAAIISLYGNCNFGNKLQNYAVQEVLKSEGLETVNIVNVPCLNNRKINKKELFKFYLKGIVHLITNGDTIIDCVDHKDPKERKKNFLRFNKRITNSKHFFSFRRLGEFNNFDYYFVGSDQIWNPLYGGLSDLALLTFVNTKKIAISASFGISEISSEFKKRVYKYISQFDFISVREDAGKKIIEREIGRNCVEVLIDPTMMLTAAEWDKILLKPKNHVSKKFITCYFLGPVNEKYQNEIRTLAEKNCCDIVDLTNIESDYYCCGPSEFVWLIKNAFCICTDSFHASAFSILYNKPFIAFDREGKYNRMGSRIETLLRTFHLTCAKYSGDILDMDLTFNYNEPNQILEKERRKVDHFLQNALH